MKTVDSLPSSLIQEADSYMRFHPRAILLYILPIIFFYLAPQNAYEKDERLIGRVVHSLMELNKPLLTLLSVYLFLIFFSKLSRILWKFDKAQWFKYYISLAVAVCVSIFCKHFDFNHWLLHEYGYLTDMVITPWVALAGFIPMIAAHLDSFRSVELAFYKSKGFNYTGRLPRRFDT